MEQVIPNGIRENFRCPICTDLLQEPVSLRTCQHMFCGPCIRSFVSTGGVLCPYCQTQFEPPNDLAEPLRIVRSVLESFRINCPHQGCNEQIRYEQFDAHILQCQYHPNAVSSCSYCDQKYPKIEEEQHQANVGNCVKFLKRQRSELASKLEESEAKIIKVESDLQSIKSELEKTKTELEKTKNDFKSEMTNLKTELENTKIKLEKTETQVTNK